MWCYNNASLKGLVVKKYYLKLNKSYYMYLFSLK